MFYLFNIMNRMSTCIYISEIYQEQPESRCSGGVSSKRLTISWNLLLCIYEELDSQFISKSVGSEEANLIVILNLQKLNRY